MVYKRFKDISLSALGLGCMRLPTVSENGSQVDREALREMVAYAIDNGVNYFDTAWGYHGGDSEKAVGEVLKDYPRETVYLASKFPGYDLNNMDKVKEIFEAQLGRCQVDYFDFYLIHNVCEMNIDAYLDPQYGIMDYLLDQKKRGRIRFLGFSTHGTLDTMRRFLDAYGEYMEFCQIQLNWLDWKLQNADEKVALLKKHSLPIWVMEPVRGGKLVTLESEYEARLKALRPSASVVEWAFRFLQSLPDVVVTLSGMSNMAQLKDNIATYQEEKALSAKEQQTLLDIARRMISKNGIPCTACRYCVDHCPKSLDIPRIMELYNEHVYSDGGFLAPMAIGAMPDDKKPSACIGCRSCEKVCPQTIEISAVMRGFTERLNT